MATHKQLNEERRSLSHFIEQFISSVVSNSNMSAVDLEAVKSRRQEILITQFRQIKKNCIAQLTGISNKKIILSLTSSGKTERNSTRKVQW